MLFLSRPYRALKREGKHTTQAAGGYASLAWGYDYLSPTGIMAATPLNDGGLLYIGYASLTWGYDCLSPTGIMAATPLYLLLKRYDNALKVKSET
jgi:hypothetical protein